MATWLIPISLHALNMSFSLAAPSSSEYWVWTCRWVKGWSVKAATPPARTGHRNGLSGGVGKSTTRVRHRGPQPGGRTRRTGQVAGNHPGARVVPPVVADITTGDGPRGEHILSVFDSAF